MFTNDLGKTVSDGEKYITFQPTIVYDIHKIATC